MYLVTAAKAAKANSFPLSLSKVGSFAVVKKSGAVQRLNILQDVYIYIHI